MKVLNIIDLNLLKIFLNKFYLAHGIDYLFLIPHRETIEKHLPQFDPDIVLLQHHYYNFTIEEITTLVRSLTAAPIIVFVLKENRDITERLSHLTEKDANLMVYTKHEFTRKFEELLTTRPRRDDEASLPEGRRAILLADDSAVMRHFFRKTLADRDFDVYIASDGEEAWELYQKHLPNLVITDIEMPRMDGLQLCKKIKAVSYTHLTLPTIYSV